MVRVAVISDTHGDFLNLRLAVQRLGEVDWLLHAGDFYRDADVCARQLGLPNERVLAVVGNCDMAGYDLGHNGRLGRAQEMVEIDGVSILLTHGHHYGVKNSLDRIYYRTKEVGARVAVFGHSHVAANVDDGGVLLFNPGSLSSPRRLYDPPTVGLLEIRDGYVASRILPLVG